MVSKFTCLWHTFPTAEGDTPTLSAMERTEYPSSLKVTIVARFALEMVAAHPMMNKNVCGGARKFIKIGL
jgi:hypothetical protein